MSEVEAQDDNSLNNLLKDLTEVDVISLDGDPSEEHSSDDSVSSQDDEIDEQPVKRKRGRPKKEFKLPRFLVQDIRKCYTKMLQNVLNSDDFPLLYGFLETYFGTSPQLSTSKWVKGVPEKLFTMNFYGLDEIAKYWYCAMNMNPDNVLMLSDHSVQHTTGLVMSNLHGDGTRIYEEPPLLSSYYAPYVFFDEKYGKDDMFVRDLSTNDIIVGHTKETTSEKKRRLIEIDSIERRKAKMRSIIESVDSAVSHLPLRPKPQLVSCDGILIMYTDENKRITKMELRNVWY